MNAIGYIIRIIAVLLLFYFSFTLLFSAMIYRYLDYLYCFSARPLFCYASIQLIEFSSRFVRTFVRIVIVLLQADKFVKCHRWHQLLQRTMLWFNQVLQLMAEVLTLIHYKHRLVTKNVSKNELKVSKIETLTAIVPKWLFLPSERKMRDFLPQKQRCGSLDYFASVTTLLPLRGFTQRVLPFQFFFDTHKCWHRQHQQYIACALDCIKNFQVMSVIKIFASYKEEFLPSNDGS